MALGLLLPPIPWTAMMRQEEEEEAAVKDSNQLAGLIPVSPQIPHLLTASPLTLLRTRMRVENLQAKGQGLEEMVGPH